VQKQRPDAGAFVRERDTLLYSWKTKEFFPFWEKARRIVEQRGVSARDVTWN
jgi:hypothetical protein